MYAPEGASSNDCYVYFDVSGDKSQNTQPVYPFETITEGSNRFFGFKCYINSVQMADEIHAVLKYGDKTVKHTYTAKEYLDELIADTTQPEDAIELGKAFKDYGCYVQPVLADYNGWEIGKKHAKMDSADDYSGSDFSDTDTKTASHALNRDIP